MSTKLYVGNLSFNTTEGELKETFEKHGALTSVKIITDRETGRSRGFGFVEMDSAEAAQTAMDAINDHEIDGRQLKVMRRIGGVARQTRDTHDA